MRRLWLWLLILTGSLLVACGQGAREQVGVTTAVSPSPTTAPTVTPSPTETPMPDNFFVIAYVTTAVIPGIIPYEQLTHINYSFLIPNDDGTFAPMANGWKLKEIAAEADKYGVDVLISVGGWGWDAQFETMAADAQSRAAFVQNLSAFVDEYGLDGADIDWEYPDPGQSAQNFLLLIEELRAAMPDKLITTAVVAYGATGDGVPAETFEIFDFVNVMTYEGHDHGSMEQFRTGMAYWLGRGLPAEKMVMGVPFYADPTGVAYAKLVEADPQNAQLDSIEWNRETIHYNGIPTIQEKTRMAMQEAGGIMFWTLEHDALNELSLLRAIDVVVKEEQ